MDENDDAAQTAEQTAPIEAPVIETPAVTKPVRTWSTKVSALAVGGALVVGLGSGFAVGAVTADDGPDHAMRGRFGGPPGVGPQGGPGGQLPGGPGVQRGERQGSGESSPEGQDGSGDGT